MGFSRGSEVVPKHLAESERETQERTRTAQIEQRDAPRIGHLEYRADVGYLDDVGQVVHEQRRTQSGDGKQYQVDRTHQIRSFVPDPLTPGFQRRRARLRGPKRRRPAWANWCNLLEISCA